MSDATGKTFAEHTSALASARALKQQGLKSAVIGPLKSAYITGPDGTKLPWPVAADKSYYLVIGTDGTIETP